MPVRIWSKNKMLLSRAVGLSVACGWIMPAFAANRTWTDNNANGLWGNHFNWSPTTRPDENDTALFGPGAPNGFTVDLGGINRPVDEITFSGSTGFTLNNGTLQLVGRTLNVTGNATHTLNTLVNFTSIPFSPIPGPANINVDANATLDLAGGVGGLGFFSVNKNGAGTLVFSSANTYSVLTFIHEGTLQLAHVDALQNSTAIINIDNGLDITTHAIDANLGGLAGAGAFNIGTQNITVQQGDYSGILSGAGALTKVQGADLRLSGANTYTGGTTINSGALIVSNTAGSATGSGIVTVMDGAFLSGQGIILGQVNVERFAMIAPGEDALGEDASGILTISNIDFARGSEYEVDLGGLRLGVQYDQLVVTQQATIDTAAMLEVSLIEAFVPELGDAFQIFDFAGSVTGTFQRIDLPTLDAGLGWNLQDLYTTGEMRVERLGDLDTDGFVGAADIDILLANWGDEVLGFDYTTGDVSGDGLVNNDDLQIVLNQFGSGTPGGGVPEPGSLALLGLSFVALSKRRRQRI